MKDKLIPSDVVGKISWQSVMDYYFPDCSKQEQDYILFEKTCFPFDDEVTLDQLFDEYTKRQET